MKIKKISSHSPDATLGRLQFNRTHLFITEVFKQQTKRIYISVKFLWN